MNPAFRHEVNTGIPRIDPGVTARVGEPTARFGKSGTLAIEGIIGATRYAYSADFAALAGDGASGHTFLEALEVGPVAQRVKFRGLQVIRVKRQVLLK